MLLLWLRTEGGDLLIILVYFTKQISVCENNLVCKKM
jgi:hypothetical protein